MQMNPQYRAELRDLRKARRKTFSDFNKFVRDADKQIKLTQRSVTKAQRAVNKQVGRIDRRMAILRGRLS